MSNELYSCKGTLQLCFLLLFPFDLCLFVSDARYPAGSFIAY